MFIKQVLLPAKRGKMPVSNTDLMAMAARIADSVQPERIILFGSYARGDATDNSDVDLLVITKETYGPNNSRRKVLAKLARVLSRIRVPIDIILSSMDEVIQWQDSRNHLIAHAVREGKVLYERH